VLGCPGKRVWMFCMDPVFRLRARCFLLSFVPVKYWLGRSFLRCVDL